VCVCVCLYIYTHIYTPPNALGQDELTFLHLNTFCAAHMLRHTHMHRHTHITHRHTQAYTRTHMDDRNGFLRLNGVKLILFEQCRVELEFEIVRFPDIPRNTLETPLASTFSLALRLKYTHHGHGNPYVGSLASSLASYSSESLS
jgi:hypothetical protein